jgi:hypothetical protein
MAGTFTAWRMRRVSTRDAQRRADLLLDVVIMASVLMFMLLAAGVGVLALQTSLH